MKNFSSFNEFLNESAFRLDPKETIIGKLDIHGYGRKWEMKAISLDDSGDEYIIITGEYARSTTDGDTLWIPKDQFDEFKKMIRSI